MSAEATAKLVTYSLILSCLNYCNALLSGLPASSIHCIQHIQNSATRLVRKKKIDHISSLLRSLHWLPVAQRIRYEIDIRCCKCIHGSTPSYLCDTVHLYSPSHAHPLLYIRCFQSQNPTIQTFYCWLSLFLCLWSLCLEQTPSASPSNTHPEQVQIEH